MADHGAPKVAKSTPPPANEGGSNQALLAWTARQNGTAATKEFRATLWKYGKIAAALVLLLGAFFLYKTQWRNSNPPAASSARPAAGPAASPAHFTEERVTLTAPVGRRVEYPITKGRSICDWRSEPLGEEYLVEVFNIDSNRWMPYANKAVNGSAMGFTGKAKQVTIKLIVKKEGAC